MGDDIGNILYVLIILLSVVFSAFKKKKKPAAPSVPQNKKSRPSFDPMKELETFLENFEDEKQSSEKQRIPEVEIIKDEERVIAEEKEEVYNPFMQHLDDERFQEAVPQTFSDDVLISDDIKDIAPLNNSDNTESSTERSFDEQIEYEKSLRKKSEFFKKFNAKDAIIYSAIINRPYQ